MSLSVDNPFPGYAVNLRGESVTVVRSSVFSVLKLFPDRRDMILRRSRERESFRTACEDYETCLRSLRHWSDSKTEEATVRREEYAAMLEDLEAEIAQHLEESQA